MKARWSHWLEELRTSFWFVPIVMLLLAIGLALLLLFIDGRVDPGIRGSLDWAYTGGPEGARSLLSTVAGSMITAASVTFSLASVALSIAAQQYGSRVLRNFMRDRITQVLLGTFVSTFVYSVLVVRSIRGSDFAGGFVPDIAVTGALVLALASLVLLIFFVHHVSTSIKASHIVRVIAEDTEEAIPKLYPEGAGEPADGAAEAWDDGRQAVSVTVDTNGYLQMVDLDQLMELAEAEDAMIRLCRRPGDYVIAGDELARVTGPAELPENGVRRARGAFVIGRERTAEQDIRYQFQQLADVIIRALSPAINDPFTAATGINVLASSTVLLARTGRSMARKDRRGVVRLQAKATSTGEILDETVGHIAIYATQDRFVMRKLAGVLDAVGPHLAEAADCATLERLRRGIEARLAELERG